MKKEYKIYLLDFDGTIINSYEGLYHFYNDVFNPYDITISRDAAYKLSKISLQEAFDRLIGKPELMGEFTKRCYEVVDSKVLLRYNTPYEDAISLIKYIKDNNFISGIVTGNDIIHCKMVLDNVKLGNFYHTFVGSKELCKQKPHPEGILLALSKLNYQGDKKDVCYIGDSWNDFLAAKAAGVTPILVDRFNEFKESDEYIKISSLEELI